MKNTLKIIGAILFVLAFTLTNKSGDIDGMNLLSLVCGFFCIAGSERMKK